GRISVAGSDHAYKDAKIWPGGSREWDWNETGTRHVPGVQPADVEEIVERDVDVLVIGRGLLGALQVKDETREALTDAGVEIEVARTDEAVRRYNELRESRAVGALFHTTC
ncbi:MAG: Mth938-like domain-containing protein, partial [Gemmatimonadota bacterium]|nr:Mth938-like domain-containing protein [Gemmatimonadota bacterium]